MPTDSPWYPMALAHHCEALCLLSDCSFGLVLGEDGTGRAPHVPPRLSGEVGSETTLALAQVKSCE
jgi:hypothetical protein